jgi:hypothetical protein
MKEINPFCKSLEKDYGNPDIYGPWTKKEDMIDINGNPKVFKDFYLISTDGPSPVIDKIETDEEKIESEGLINWFLTKINKKSKI